MEIGQEPAVKGKEQATPQQENNQGHTPDQVGKGRGELFQLFKHELLSYCYSAQSIAREQV